MRISRETGALLVILGVAAAGRSSELGQRPLWLDEQFSVSQALGAARKDPVAAGPTFTPADVWRPGSFEQMVSASGRQDSANGMLYSVLLRGWMAVAGFSDARVRIPSVLADLAIILLVFGFSRELLGGRVALIAAAICAVNPLLFALSREARAYTFATGTSLGATWLFFRLLFRPASQPRWGPWIGYAALAIASLLLHYLSAGVLAGHALLALRFARRRDQWLGAGVAAALIVVALSVWMGLWGYQGADSAGAQQAHYVERLARAAPGEDYVLPATPRNVAAGWVQVILPLLGNYLQLSGLPLSRLLPLALIPLALIGLAFATRRDPQDRRLLGALLALFLSCPLVAVAASLRAGHIVPFQPRYCEFSLPYAMILIAVGVACAWERASWRWAARALVGLFLLVQVASTVGVWRTSFTARREPYRALAAELVAKYRPGDIVSFRSWRTARLVNLYLPRSSGIVQRVVPGPDIADLTMTVGR